MDNRITSLSLYIATEEQLVAAHYWGGPRLIGESVLLPAYMVLAFGADSFDPGDHESPSILRRYPLIRAWQTEIKAHYRACLTTRREWPECVVRKPKPLALP